jgi:hypothetical protein
MLNSNISQFHFKYQDKDFSYTMRNPGERALVCDYVVKSKIKNELCLPFIPEQARTPAQTTSEWRKVQPYNWQCQKRFQRAKHRHLRREGHGLARCMLRQVHQKLQEHKIVSVYKNILIFNCIKMILIML